MPKLSPTDRTFLGRMMTWALGVMTGLLIGRMSVEDGWRPALHILGFVLTTLLAAYVIVTQFNTRRPTAASVTDEDDDAPTGN
jgi:hypothetical protein